MNTVVDLSQKCAMPTVRVVYYDVFFSKEEIRTQAVRPDHHYAAGAKANKVYKYTTAVSPPRDSVLSSNRNDMTKKAESK